jgi:hypothetical protein
MVATENHRIEVTEDELAALLRSVGYVDLEFGPGWSSLVWRKGEEMPAAVRHLGLMRGVLNENTDGAGI